MACNKLNESISHFLAFRGENLRTSLGGFTVSVGLWWKTHSLRVVPPSKTGKIAVQRLPSELKYYCYYCIALECSVRFSRSFVGQRKGVRVHFGGRPIASGDTADDNNNSCTPLLCW